VRPNEYHDPATSISPGSVHRHGQRYHDAADALLAHGKLPEGAVVMDVACGTGYGTEMLAMVLRDCQVIGVDRNPLALARARKQSGRAQYHNHDLGDCRRWLRVYRPHAVVCIETLEHLDGPAAQRQWVAAVASNLQPGGLFWIACPVVEQSGPSLANSWHLWEPTHDEVLSMLRWAGLEVVTHWTHTYTSTAGEAACQLSVLAQKP